MRYDTLVQEIVKAQNRYEATVRRLVQAAAATDRDLETSILSHVRKPRSSVKKRKYTKRKTRKPMSAARRRQIGLNTKAAWARRRAEGRETRAVSSAA